MGEKQLNLMSQVVGLVITGVSVLLAAITSGLRLKPYMDAGIEQTPMTFAVYPAGIALAITVPTVFLSRWWQGKRNVDIGPATFTDNSLFVVLGRPALHCGGRHVLPLRTAKNAPARAPRHPAFSPLAGGQTFPDSNPYYSSEVF